MSKKPIRIAVLILAHKNPMQLQNLINHLASDFDVYVHIDKKFLFLGAEGAANFISNHNISWGSKEQISATIDLFKLAHKKHYDRYIFISGQDIPLCSNQKIIEFFTQNDNNYIDYRSLPSADGWGGGPTIKRMSLFWFNESRDKKSIKRVFKKRLQKLLHSLQKKLKLYRKIPEKLYGGANWMDLTGDAMDKIISYIDENPSYLKFFNHTRCADEIFFHTILINNTDIKKCINQSLRYVDFDSGPEFPRTLRENDIEKLLNSKKLFARKFDNTIDTAVINSIYKKIKDPDTHPNHDIKI